MDNTTLHFTGPVLALVTFLTVWWGHVLVRIVHFNFGTKPAPLIFLLGSLALLATTQFSSNLAAAGLGIVGVTLLWDAFELHRQESRVRAGHAPLNPRVHTAAAGFLASSIADSSDCNDEGGMCLSCGSSEGSRFLCRRGPFCKVRNWDAKGPAPVREVGEAGS